MGRKTPATKYKEAKLEGYVQEIERLVGKKVGRIVRREIRKFNAAKRAAGQSGLSASGESKK